MNLLFLNCVGFERCIIIIFTSNLNRSTSGNNGKKDSNRVAGAAANSRENNNDTSLETDTIEKQQVHEVFSQLARGLRKVGNIGRF